MFAAAHQHMRDILWLEKVTMHAYVYTVCLYECTQ